MKRKFLNALFLLAIAVSTSMMFAACGDDDDEPEKPDTPSTEKVVKDVEFTTSLCVNKLMLDTYDIVGKTPDGKKLEFSASPVDISIIMPTGKTDVPMYQMSVYADGKAVPLSSAMEVNFTLKDGYTAPATSELIIAIDSEGLITYTDGSSKKCTNNEFRWYNSGIKADHLADFGAKLNKTCGYINATITEEGIKISRKAPTAE